MATFEINPLLRPENTESSDFDIGSASVNQEIDQNFLRDECIISFKVYDSCRQQVCLTKAELGLSRSAENANIFGNCISEGDIISVPDEVATITIDNISVSNISVIEKTASTLRKGYWNIRLKYTFQYRLTFRQSNGDELDFAWAYSTFFKMACLFGSAVDDLVIATDFLKRFSGVTNALDAEPFVLVEAKAVAISADVYSSNIVVSIGLFTIIKLFRIVQLVMETKGFCIPEKCVEISENPCDIFYSLDFPVDLFAPPQKPDFLAK